MTDDETATFLKHLDALPAGYREGTFEGRRYGVTRKASPDAKRVWLFGEALDGSDRISCNVYRLGDGRALLKPCEMPLDKVVDFVLRFRPQAAEPAGDGMGDP